MKDITLLSAYFDTEKALQKSFGPQQKYRGGFNYVKELARSPGEYASAILAGSAPRHS